jgi:hypothetical protein
MKAIAASIVVLAGALIYCVGIQANGGDVRALGIIGGGMVCLVGLVVLIREHNLKP